jgi:hypothetical protein
MKPYRILIALYSAAGILHTSLGSFNFLDPVAFTWRGTRQITLIRQYYVLSSLRTHPIRILRQPLSSKCGQLDMIDRSKNDYIPSFEESEFSIQHQQRRNGPGTHDSNTIFNDIDEVVAMGGDLSFLPFQESVRNQNDSGAKMRLRTMDADEFTAISVFSSNVTSPFMKNEDQESSKDNFSVLNSDIEHFEWDGIVIEDAYFDDDE